MGGFRIFGTTADEGIEIESETIEGLFALAVEGFVSVLLGGAEAVRPREHRKLMVEGEDARDLLVGLLNELIYTFDAHRWVPRTAEEVEFRQTALSIVLKGEPYHPGIHPPAVEIKAATYHGAEVWQERDGWHARVILDL